MSGWHPEMPPEYRNQIVTGDARLLAERIPDESVDLVFTDPVYERIEDYYWLGRTAARVLKPGGVLLVYYWGADLLEVASAVRQPALRFRWNVFDLKIGTASLDGGQFVRCMSRPALVLCRDFIPRDGWLSDVVYSRPSGASVNHRWSKNPDATRKWIAMIAGQVVFDPFTGGGTVPAVCRSLGRNFVAFEIDPETAALARERVRLTPEPLLVLDAPDPQETLAL